MKIVSIIETRPQFVKYASVPRELRHIVQEVLVHTGQQYDGGMSGIFFVSWRFPKRTIISALDLVGLVTQCQR